MYVLTIKMPAKQLVSGSTTFLRYWLNKDTVSGVLNDGRYAGIFHESPVPLYQKACGDD